MRKIEAPQSAMGLLSLPHHLSTALALSLGAAACVAQTTDATAPVTVLPETVVSASRVALPRASVGSAVTVITAEDIERRQARFVADVLRGVPGVAVSRGGAAGSLTQVRIRGAESNHTLVIIDGVEVTDPTNFSQEYDFANLLATDVERIEILRGAQAALWGSEAIGGVINITTRRGRPGPPRFRLSAGLGSDVGREASVAVSGAGARYHYAVQGAHYRTNGINIAQSGSEEDAYDNSTFSLRAGWRPVDVLRFDLVARTVHGNSENDAQNGGITADSAAFTDLNQNHVRLQGTWSTFDGHWEHRLGAAHGEHDTVGQNFANSGSKLKFDYQSTLLFATPQFADAEHVLVLAAEHEEDQFESGGAFAPVGRERDQIGYVAEYRVGLWRRLDLSAALRHDDNDNFEDATTLRLTGAYRLPTTGTRLHASYGEGVKNPTLFEQFGFGTSFTGNPNLRPEESEGWDVGVEQTLLGGSLVLDLTWFDQQVSNEITGNGTTAVNQAGIATSQGVEFSVRAALGSDLDLGASYTYLHTRNPIGLEQVRRPMHTAALDASYRFAAGRGNVTLTALYNGRTEDLDFRPGIFGPRTPRVTLDDYVLVNLAAHYDVHPQVQIYARVDNLLDVKYEDIFNFNTPGMTAFAGFRLNFDAP